MPPMSPEALLLISIGPVQEFIAAARRTRDLWFGSWLLSELAKAAAKALADDCGHERLIFPAPAMLAALAPDSELTVANKLVALVPAGKRAADVAKHAHAAVELRLKRLWGLAYAKAKVKGPYRTSAAEAQRDDLVEFAWVALPLADQASYAETRQLLEALMAARKTTRSFGPVKWGGPYHKSSLDGLREAVIELSEIRDRSDQALYNDYGIRRGEHLCGIGLLKRHGRRITATAPSDQDRFFSTSHVAALPLLGLLAQRSAMAEHELKDKQAVETYIKALRTAGIAEADLGFVPARAPNGPFEFYDGHLLFAERLAEYILPNSTLPQAEQQADYTIRIEGARQALKNFIEAVFGKPALTPCPYYALLHADGDGMGKAIDAQQTHEQHRTLSQALDTFSAEVRGSKDTWGIVERHQGSLVYTGGDDVLAFLPLHTAVACARALADRFHKLLKPYTYAGAMSPTLSVGIAIVHHLEPLSDALDYARKAEQAAKQLPGKNALAVTLSRRSGVDRQVRGCWEPADATIGALDTRLMRFARGFAANQIPDGLAFEWADLHRRLATTDSALAARLLAPLRADARRILDRKRTEAGEKIKSELVETLHTLVGRAVLRADQAGAAQTLAQLADELIIGRAIADAVRQATLPPATARKDAPNAAAAD